MSKKNLTNTEKRILSWLDRDSRISFRKIGKGIRKSEQNVSYTVNSLTNRGIIRNFYTMVDYSRFSILNFRVFFKINYITDKKFEEIEDYLSKEPHVMWLASCGGRYDLICTFGARNPSQFNKILKGIMAKFSRQIQNYDILTTIVLRIMERDYLGSKKEKRDVMIVGGDREPYELQEKDITLISEIADIARKSSVEISRKVGCNARTVLNRIKALEGMEVIRGFKTFIDFSETNYITKILLLRYHNISVEDEERLIKYLCNDPNVMRVTKTMGRWDLEVRIETEDERDFRKTVRKIREEFSEMIQFSETIPIYNEFRNTFFPRFIIDEIRDKGGKIRQA
ncbi:MAG: Lrp/AsnC family transcriptional regulator [Candidatus Aenigmarchaeota archaeon]|nr:Lrp/AsnC family transcriptional regulator [Candidatus Aenigmarchaeota archaeon]